MSFADLKAMIFGKWTKPGMVDVAKILDDLADKAHQNFDWRHSVVDLMNLLDLDANYDNRRQLARELGFSGDVEDTVAMNIWLHKAIMQKLAENGGKVPDELR